MRDYWDGRNGGGDSHTPPPGFLEPSDFTIFPNNLAYLDRFPVCYRDRPKAIRAG